MCQEVLDADPDNEHGAGTKALITMCGLYQSLGSPPDYQRCRALMTANMEREILSERRKKRRAEQSVADKSGAGAGGGADAPPHKINRGPLSRQSPAAAAGPDATACRGARPHGCPPRGPPQRRLAPPRPPPRTRRRAASACPAPAARAPRSTPGGRLRRLAGGAGPEPEPLARAVDAAACRRGAARLRKAGHEEAHRRVAARRGRTSRRRAGDASCCPSRPARARAENRSGRPVQSASESASPTPPAGRVPTAHAPKDGWSLAAARAWRRRGRHGRSSRSFTLSPSLHPVAAGARALRAPPLPPWPRHGCAGRVHLPAVRPAVDPWPGRPGPTARHAAAASVSQSAAGARCAVRGVAASS
jgi:hypothetical protein